ncbi:hypothetical protein DQ150_25940 [Escherichia coli]|nr:hypothetical protein [Escherichia coli]
MLDLIISIKSSIFDVFYSQYVNHSFWLGVLLINLICIISLIIFYFITKKQNQKKQYWAWIKTATIILFFISLINYHYYEPSPPSFQKNPYSSLDN